MAKSLTAAASREEAYYEPGGVRGLTHAVEMKVRDVIRIIEEDGWRFHSQKGSHRQYKHPFKAGRVTIAGKPGDDMAPKTLADVFRQARIERQRR